MKLLMENWHQYLTGSEIEYLFHGTSTKFKNYILENGTKSPSYWGTEEVAKYYAEEVVEQHGGKLLIIKVPMSKFKEEFLKPDENSVAEPLTYTLGKTEDEVWEEWKESDGTWRDSFDIVSSVKYNAPLKIEEKETKILDFLEEALILEKDPKKGTGKKPKGSGRRLYTDEDPSDTVSVKFRTVQDIKDTLSKESFKSKSHKRQSQIINLIHQRARAAYRNAKDPKVKARLKKSYDYAKKRKEASKEKTKRMNKKK